MRYAKSRINLSGRELIPTGQEKPGKTSLDCATIALKVLKTSMRQQVKMREKQSQESVETDWSESLSVGTWAGR